MWSKNKLLLLLISFSLKSTDAFNDWTHLMFSQSWPATVCRVYVDSNSTHTCTFPKTHNAWSIHGIWPAVSGSSGPGYCNQTWLFNPEEIKPIQPRLEQGWINVEDGTPYDSLWDHEWNKHGTCAASIEPLNSQIKYFSQGLQWLQKYTMAAILSEANILPSDTKAYPQDYFYKAVKNKLGVDPDINCLHDGNGKQYLWELRICFSKTLEMIDCNPSNIRMFYINDVSFISNCNSDGVIYSTAKPPKFRLPGITNNA